MRRKTLAATLAAAAVALAATPALAEPPPISQPLFVITYRAGPAWKPGVPMNRQALGPHAAYWARMQAEGRAVGAGPMLDADGGMAIVRASDIAAARALVAADPAVTSGVFAAEMHPWEPRFGDGGPLRIRH
jgi:uncharacterized protein YciI